MGASSVFVVPRPSFCSPSNCGCFFFCCYDKICIARSIYLAESYSIYSAQFSGWKAPGLLVSHVQTNVLSMTLILDVTGDQLMYWIMIRSLPRCVSPCVAITAALRQKRRCYFFHPPVLLLKVLRVRFIHPVKYPSNNRHSCDPPSSSPPCSTLL